MIAPLTALLIWVTSQLSANQWLWPVIAVTSSLVLLLVGGYAIAISVRYERLQSSVVRSW